MYRYTEEDKEIIAKARKANKNRLAENRLYALELRVAGKGVAEVAAATGFHAAYISQLTAKFRIGGIEAITGNHYGINRRVMTPEDEAVLLEPFREKAEQGQAVDISEIKATYEQAVGHTIDGSQIYYALYRNGLRKFMPRSKHAEKASEDGIAVPNLV